MKNEPFAVKRECYAMATRNSGKSGEITLYGRVVDKRPIANYWTGEKDGGDYIVQSEFLEDLKNLKDCSELNINLNSVGGLVSAGITIHNKLREMASKGVKITCTVDGVAMSAGSLIMCAADTIKAYPSSLIMVHKASMLFYENLNADELRKAADELDAFDKAIIAAYKRKTCKNESELEAMMSVETYMTGEEAKEKGFVDEILEGENKAKISASADRHSLIVDGHVLPLGGLKCPENIPVLADFSAIINDIPSPSGNPEGLDNTQSTTNEGGNPMAETQKPAGAPAEPAPKASEEEINAAVLAERERLQKIDKIAAQFGADLVAEAKYTKPCTAEELAYKAALASAEKGASFLNALNDDAKDSNANNVNAAAAKPDGAAGQTEAEIRNEVDAAIDAALKEDEE